jgi:endo-1,3(4)-beta-glucanase
MGFVSAIYRGSTPLIQSSVFFHDVQPAGRINDGSTRKYRIILEDGKTWLMYVSQQPGSNPVPPFNKINNTTIKGLLDFLG